MIIEEIDRRFRNHVLQKTNSPDLVENVAIIKNGMIRMANLGVAVAFKVNGVAELHTHILKTEVFKDFSKVFPSKIVNITNGITHRRWIVYSNEQLTALISSKIGDEWIKKPSLLENFYRYGDDEKTINQLAKIKKERKQILADFVLKTQNITIDIDSIFDVQIKRLHAYKRQLLNVLNIIHLYYEIKRRKVKPKKPITFIFAAKAAPSYVFAKKVIELICGVGKTINDDEQVKNYLKVVFIENYDVSKAEIIIPASDISEQISTAGKEASGTGNMKLMLNGALTLGTLDGANVQIYELVGKEDIEIFGMTVDDIEDLRKKGYQSYSYYIKDPDIKEVIDSLEDGSFGAKEQFKMITQELLGNNDSFYILADFRAYVKAHSQICERYNDKKGWYRSIIHNIARAGYFSSDRAVEEYVEKIWKLQKVSK
jgi:starch phosphorylase